MEKREPFYAVGRNVNWCSHNRKIVWMLLIKLKIELPCDLAIPLLGLYPDKTIIQKDTCTPAFIAMVFIIAKTWKQSKCPSTDEWIKNMWYIYTIVREGNGNPVQYSCLENPMDGRAWWAAVHGVTKSWTQLSNFTFTFHFHALKKEMATHSSILVWRIPGTGKPGGLPPMGSHRVGHD